MEGWAFLTTYQPTTTAACALTPLVLTFGVATRYVQYGVCADSACSHIRSRHALRAGYYLREACALIPFVLTFGIAARYVLIYIYLRTSGAIYLAPTSRSSIVDENLPCYSC